MADYGQAFTSGMIAGVLPLAKQPLVILSFIMMGIVGFLTRRRRREPPTSAERPRRRRRR